MKVIIDANIIYQNQLIMDHLSKAFEALLGTCHKGGHSMVIPLTTLYEFNRKQSEKVGEEIADLKSALKLLDKHKITHAEISFTDVVKPPNLIEMVRQISENVIVECPTFGDLNEAHKRACLHEAPHPPDSKSDEMRDLVIWCVALRISTECGGALLVSGDEVHWNARGDKEAGRAKLVRVKSIEDALDYLNEDTPSAVLVKSMLKPIWEDLRDAGIPLSQDFSVAGVSNAAFVAGIRGPSMADFTFKAQSQDGKEIEAHAKINAVESVITSTAFLEIKVQNEPWDQKKLPMIISTNKKYEIEPDDIQDRLNGLKSTLEGEA